MGTRAVFLMMMTTRALLLFLALASVLSASALEPATANFLEESRAPVEPETVCSTLCKTGKRDPGSDQPPEIECETQCLKKDDGSGATQKTAATASAPAGKNEVPGWGAGATARLGH